MGAQGLHARSLMKATLLVALLLCFLKTVDGM